ncbi:hypothetical protein [Pseudaminobacter sp. NGMCC 1.201702]|uniref:hypothetical protein n=1 Tax=Pseudaminobacter sp. NGMCC 1.201702 TaxID=3391825 RepID=UPI0039F0213E
MKRTLFSFLGAGAFVGAGVLFAYETRPAHHKAKIVAEHANGLRNIVREAGFAVGGKRATNQVDASGHDISTHIVETGLPFDLFHRAWRTRLRLILTDSDEDGTIAVDPAGEYAIDLKLSGQANVALQMSEFSGDGRQLRYISLTTLELVREHPTREFGVRFRVSPDARAVQPILWVTGQSVMNIHSADLVRLR